MLVAGNTDYVVFSGKVSQEVKSESAVGYLANTPSLALHYFNSYFNMGCVSR